MKHMIGCFTIENAQGKEVDRFEFMQNGMHATISNNSGVLFDGYFLEACGAWQEKKEDMKMVEMIGGKVVDVK